MLRYTVEVESKRGGVSCKLDGGPDGMSVSDAGLLTWPVPADFPDDKVAVVVTIKNAGAQEALHAFDLRVK